jgi:hypothetical protein
MMNPPPSFSSGGDKSRPYDCGPKPSAIALFVYTCALQGYDRPQQHFWDEAHAAALAVGTRGCSFSI